MTSNNTEMGLRQAGALQAGWGSMPQDLTSAVPHGVEHQAQGKKR